MRLIEGGKPVVRELRGCLDRAVSDASGYLTQMEEARDVRYCRWAGQSADGRKHQKAGGKVPFPWEGATDTRVPLADGIANEQMMVLMAAFFRTQVQAVGVEAADQMRSAQVTQLMKWMLYVKMLPFLWRELQLAALWRQDPGLCLLSIEWEQQTRVELQDLDIESLRTAVEAGGMGGGAESRTMLLDIADLFNDPLREAEALEILKGLSPLAKGGQAKRMLRELRETGRTQLPVPTFLQNRPRWRALRPFVDVVFPTETDDLQEAPWVARIEYIDEATLRDRVVTAGYDKAFVEEAVKQKGRKSQVVGWNEKYAGPSDQQWGIDLSESPDLIELVHFYYKDTSEYGQPVVYYTVTNMGVAAGRDELVGLHQVHGYDHGQYPFVVMTREHHTRRVADGRGVSLIAATWQHEIKVQRDARADYTQLATIPPLKIPPGRGSDFVFGPGAQWPMRRGMDPEFAQVPMFNPASIEMERATREMAARYFGLMDESVPPALQQLHQQHMVMGWMMELRLAAGQTFALIQQYMTTEQVQRVVGITDWAGVLTGEDIKGAYDFHLDFDVRNLDMEFAKEKLKLVQEVILQFDRYGTIDMAKLAEFGLQSIDPQLAAMVVSNPQQAADREVEEEQNALAQIMAGVEPAMKTGNYNWTLRLDVLRKSIERNPEMQQAIRERPIVQQMLEARVKYLSHQIQQQQNATTGLLGAEPVLGRVA